MALFLRRAYFRLIMSAIQAAHRCNTSFFIDDILFNKSRHPPTSSGSSAPSGGSPVFRPDFPAMPVARPAIPASLAEYGYALLASPPAAAAYFHPASTFSAAAAYGLKPSETSFLLAPPQGKLFFHIYIHIPHNSLLIGYAGLQLNIIEFYLSA